MPWAKCKPIANPKVVGLCGTPYHAHPKGCGFFCKRESCPPTMPPLSICLDDFYLIWSTFPIGEFVKTKMEAHPEWTVYQARNIRYWQPIARKQLKGVVARFSEEHPEYRVLGPMEHLDSWGIDMQATAAQIGIKLKYGTDWARHKLTYIIRYAGIPIEEAGKARLASLRESYPIVYHKRQGEKCGACTYRPCLRHIVHNPSRYVGRVFGKVEVEHQEDGYWFVWCECGTTHKVSFRKSLCFVCCNNKKAPQG